MAAQTVNEIEEIFDKMSYGPAPEADNVVQVNLNTNQKRAVHGLAVQISSLSSNAIVSDTQSLRGTAPKTRIWSQGRGGGVQATGDPRLSSWQAFNVLLPLT